MNALTAKRQLLVVQTGTANTASIMAGLQRCVNAQGAGLDWDLHLSAIPEELQSADYVVLPGVGSFAAARRALDQAGLIEPLQQRIALGRATLAVCLGLQLLCEGSEESPGVPGLGLLSGVARRFPSNPSTAIRIPHMGWNQVCPEDSASSPLWLQSSGYAYFANSYRLEASAQLREQGWKIAQTNYGGPFVAAVERGSVLACQFHPELSGAFGRELLSNWLAKASSPQTQLTGATPC